MPEKLTEAQGCISERQERLDTFYHQNGPCCAGCDWWHSISSRVGECRRSTMIPGADRAASLGIEGSSLALGAGHAMTTLDHACGEFRDEFDWSSLPLPYRKRVGEPSASGRPAGRLALANQDGGRADG